MTKAMTCGECRAELASMANPTGDAVSPAVREHLASCRSCRTVLSAMELLEGGAGLRVEPSPGLADAVMQHVERSRKVHGFRSLRYRVGVLAAAAAVLLVVGSHAIRTAAPRGHQANMVEVHLIFHEPAARSVSVVGDWNGWRAGAQPMAKRNGVWEITLRLKPGADYQYEFLVNDQRFIPDPRSPMKVKNGYGGENSILAT